MLPIPPFRGTWNNHWIFINSTNGSKLLLWGRRVCLSKKKSFYETKPDQLTTLPKYLTYLLSHHKTGCRASHPFFQQWRWVQEVLSKIYIGLHPRNVVAWNLKMIFKLGVSSSTSWTRPYSISEVYRCGVPSRGSGELGDPKQEWPFPPKKTNMGGWKISIFHMRYIFKWWWCVFSVVMFVLQGVTKQRIFMRQVPKLWWSGRQPKANPHPSILLGSFLAPQHSSNMVKL